MARRISIVEFRWQKFDCRISMAEIKEFDGRNLMAEIKKFDGRFTMAETDSNKLIRWQIYDCSLWNWW